MNKLIPSVLATLGGAVTALAEGTTAGGPVPYEGSVAKTIVDNSSTTLQNFITGAGTVVASVIVAGLAIWGGIALVGILKKAFSTGKGR